MNLTKYTAMILGLFIVATSARTFAAEEELARVEKNMGKVVSIQLIQVDVGTSNSKLLARTTFSDGRQNNVDVTQFSATVDTMVSTIGDAADPIVTKTSENVCYMGLFSLDSGTLSVIGR